MIDRPFALHRLAFLFGMVARPLLGAALPTEVDQPAPQMVVVAKLVAIETTGACGTFHLGAVAEYAEVAGLAGEARAERIRVLHGCPELPRPRYSPGAGSLETLTPGDLHRLEIATTNHYKIESEPPADPEGRPLFYSLRVDPAGLEERRAKAASEAVAAFYATYLESKPPGLPEGALLERLAPRLSRRLHALIVAAHAHREAWIAAHPPRPAEAGGPPIEDKPPFVDGDYFSSLFEGPQAARPLRVEPAGDGAWHVRVEFWYETPSNRWADTVRLVVEDGRPVIDDVLFSGAGEFNPSGRLTERLAERDNS